MFQAHGEVSGKRVMLSPSACMPPAQHQSGSRPQTAFGTGCKKNAATQVCVRVGSGGEESMGRRAGEIVKNTVDPKPVSRSLKRLRQLPQCPRQLRWLRYRVCVVLETHCRLTWWSFSAWVGGTNVVLALSRRITRCLMVILAVTVAHQQSKISQFLICMVDCLQVAELKTPPHCWQWYLLCCSGHCFQWETSSRCNYFEAYMATNLSPNVDHTVTYDNCCCCRFCW